MDEVKKALQERPQLLDELHSMVGSDSLTLASLAGSRTYGLSHSGSDLDVRGIYIAKTDKLLGLRPPKEQFTSAEPDAVIYELGKFVHLAMGANPVAIELLFNESPIYASELGDMLRINRSLFLSQTARLRYVGYAKSQIQRVRNMIDGAEATDRFKEGSRLKHLRHVFRLLEQGHELVSTGHLTLELSDPDLIRERSKLPLPEIEKLASEMIERLETVESPLPERVDVDAISKMLIDIRRSNF